jgi:hypothetical protein
MFDGRLFYDADCEIETRQDRGQELIRAVDSGRSRALDMLSGPRPFTEKYDTMERIIELSP